jgi:RNA polymerase sigma-70 factor (ECF subfamily)
MTRRPDDDDELLQSALKGDGCAFAEIQRRHRPWVRSLMFAFAQNEEQAEDLTQEVFLRVFLNAERYAAKGKFVPWLKRVAVNLAKDWLRRQKRATFVSLHEIEETYPAGKGFDMEELLASKAMEEEMRAAIQTLPDEQRLSLAMYYFGQMSLQDIAWAMKCPVGTVKSRIFHGLRRTRRLLESPVQSKKGDVRP